MQTCKRCGSYLSAVTWQCVRGTFCDVLNPVTVDQRRVAERRWQAGLKPSKPQLPADHGLFSDEASQLDLIEMLQDPTND